MTKPNEKSPALQDDWRNAHKPTHVQTEPLVVPGRGTTKRPASVPLSHPANDNNLQSGNRNYSQFARDHAGDCYQPAGAKMWWLP